MKVKVTVRDGEELFVKQYTIQGAEIRLCKNRRYGADYSGVDLEFLTDELSKNVDIRKVEQVR